MTKLLVYAVVGDNDWSTMEGYKESQKRSEIRLKLSVEGGKEIEWLRDRWRLVGLERWWEEGRWGERWRERTGVEMY